jgi:transposase-like protein
MFMTARRQFSPPEKVQILRLHLLEHKPISEICDQYQLNPTIFYRWQKDLFDHGTAAFERAENGSADRTAQKLQKEIVQLRSKLASKDEVISEIMAEQVRLKKHLVWPERRLGRTGCSRGGGRLRQVLERTNRPQLSPDRPMDRNPAQQVLPVAGTLRKGQRAQGLDPEGLLASRLGEAGDSGVLEHA